MSEDPNKAQQPPPYPASVHLRGGLNFSTWADLKWSRANTHVAALQAKFGEWHASAPVAVEGVLRDDRQGIDLVARVPRGIPKQEWSLGLGDAVHNMRSAFDAVAWGMAHFEGAKPARAKSVAFPICDNAKQWEDALSAWVGDLPTEFQERIRILQPFTYSPGQTAVLSMLHKLDIQDKHCDMLTVNAHLHEINLQGSFAYEDAAVQAVPTIETFPNVEFADGVTLGTIHAGDTITLASQMILRPAMRAELTYGESTYEVMPLLHQFLQESRRYLDILMLGLAPPQIVDGGWNAMDVGSL